jgi:ABC-2 type transport system permease protein
MLAAVALWIFSFFIGFASDLVAGALAPVKNPRDPEEMVANRRVADAASLASPAVLYSQATSTILDPYRRTRSNLVLTGPTERLSLGRFQNPLPLDQSLVVVWPYLTLLAALTLVCFGLSYFIIMRQEIRSV